MVSCSWSWRDVDRAGGGWSVCWSSSSRGSWWSVSRRSWSRRRGRWSVGWRSWRRRRSWRSVRGRLDVRGGLSSGRLLTSLDPDGLGDRHSHDNIVVDGLPNNLALVGVMTVVRLAREGDGSNGRQESAGEGEHAVGIHVDKMLE